MLLLLFGLLLLLLLWLLLVVVVDVVVNGWVIVGDTIKASKYQAKRKKQTCACLLLFV